jgi:hypothetical protein
LQLQGAKNILNHPQQRQSILPAIALAACLAATATILPANAAKPERDAINTNSNNKSSPQIPSNSLDRLTQRNAQMTNTRSWQSPEDIERQAYKQNAWFQDLEWRKHYGDLDPTPTGEK